MSKVTDIRMLIASGNTEEALAELKHNYASGTFMNLTLMLLSRFNQVEEREIAGDLSTEQLTLEKNKITSGLLKLLNKIEKEELQGKTLAGVNQQLEEKTLIHKLLEILEESYQGFKAQAEIRNQLYYKILNRLSIKPGLEFEDFFNRYYSEMNDEEQALHESIREYTQEILSVYNKKALELIIGNEKLYAQIPLLKDLERHLLVWLGKYETVFNRSLAYSLIYTGVKENVPFPMGVENALEKYLSDQDTR